MARELLCECGECPRCKHRAYMHEWLRRPGNAAKVRRRVREYRAANLETIREKDRIRGHRVYDKAKEKARRKAYHELQYGRLQRQPCEVCGAVDVQMHHDDYAKPLEVRWLCPPHHGEIHRKLV
jgi:hypothetical protein